MSAEQYQCSHLPSNTLQMSQPGPGIEILKQYVIIGICSLYLCSSVSPLPKTITQGWN